MLNNDKLASVRVSDIMNPDAERLISNYINNSNAREMLRMMAIGLGVPVDNLYDIHGIGSTGLICLMYMYEGEYCGSRTHPSVWGANYTEALLGNPRTTGSNGSVGRSSLWFRDGVEATDILCIAYVCAASRGTWFVLDRMLSKYAGRLDFVAFSKFIRYEIENRNTNTGNIYDLLTKLQDGVALKCIMDTLNDAKSDARTRDTLVNLRDRTDFEALCRHVTTRIAVSLTPVAETPT